MDGPRTGSHDDVVPVSEHELATFAQLCDEAGTPTERQARLPALHARTLSLASSTSSPAGPEQASPTLEAIYFSSLMCARNQRSKRDGTICPRDGVCQILHCRWVLSWTALFCRQSRLQTLRSASVLTHPSYTTHIDLEASPGIRLHLLAHQLPPAARPRGAPAPACPGFPGPNPRGAANLGRVDELFIQVSDAQADWPINRANDFEWFIMT